MSIISTEQAHDQQNLDRHAIALTITIALATAVFIVLRLVSRIFDLHAKLVDEACLVAGTTILITVTLLGVYCKHRQHIAKAFLDVSVALQDSESRVSRMTEEALETNQLMEHVSMHFNELFQRIPAPCFCYDSDGRFKEWNRAFENFTLLEPSKIINQSVSKYVFIDADSTRMKSLMNAVFSGESFEGLELQTISGTGSCKTILCNMFPLRGEGGVVTAAICAGIDISERIRLELRMLQHVEMLNASQLKLQDQHAELVQANGKLEMLAMSDSLTGLSNHRALQERLAAEFKRSNRYGSALSVLLIDVDRFKKYNDSYGHLAGDAVLKEVAGILSRSMRDTDFVARYGGEEFVVILPHADYLGSLEAAERLRSAIEQAPWELMRVTVSIGVTTLSVEKVHYSELIAQADIALYHCKQHGRNQVTHVKDLAIGDKNGSQSLLNLQVESGDQRSFAL